MKAWISQGIALPLDDHKYRIQVAIQDKTENCITSKVKESKGTYNRWSEIIVDKKNKNK